MRLRRLCLTAAPAWFARHLRPSSAEVGLAGERLAERFLRRAGWRCLGRRVSTAAGEVDLVALDAGRLVCVEVKTSLRERARLWRPADRFRRKAWLRQRAAAGSLAAAGLGDGRPARVDLIEIWIGMPGSAVRVQHHRDLRGWPAERG